VEQFNHALPSYPVPSEVLCKGNMVFTHSWSLAKLRETVSKEVRDV
jgi:hypothetical protein